MIARSHGNFTCDIEVTNRYALGNCAVDNCVTVSNMTNPST